jgi:hypothetical protein
MQQILELLLANQEKAEAKRKAYHEALNKMNAKMDANQAKVIEQEGILAEISARIDTNLNEIRKKLNLVKQK